MISTEYEYWLQKIFVIQMFPTKGGPKITDEPWPSRLV